LLFTALVETQLKEELDRVPTLLMGTSGTWIAATPRTRQTVMVGPSLGALSDGAITVAVRPLIPDFYGGSKRNLVYTVTTYIAYWIAVNIALVRMMIKEVRRFQDDI